MDLIHRERAVSTEYIVPSPKETNFTPSLPERVTAEV
jgi:hypothetical protein